MNYTYNSGGSGFAAGFFIIYLLFIVAIYVVTFAGVWKMFTKAGRPGWAAIVPFYNWWVWLEIIDRPRWWFWAAFAVLLAWVPILNIVIILGLYFIVGMAILDMAKCFGKGSFHEIGLVVLPFVFAPILGWGDAQFIGPVAAGLPHAVANATRPAPTAPGGYGAATPPPPPASGYAVPPAPPAPPAAPVTPAPTPAPAAPVTPPATPAAPVTPPATPAATTPAAPVTPPVTAETPETAEAAQEVPPAAPAAPDVPPVEPPASSPPPPPPLS